MIRKFLAASLTSLAFCSIAFGFGDGGSNPGRITAEEEDGSPSVRTRTIKFSNGSVTDNGDGSASVAVGGAVLPLPSGSTSYLEIRDTLQANSTFYASSGTVNQLRTSTLTVTGNFSVIDGSASIHNPYGLQIGTMMIVQPGAGNVGIGTTSPGSKLHVIGTATLSDIIGGSAANSDIFIQGTSNGTKSTSYVIMQPDGGKVLIGGKTEDNSGSNLEIYGTNSLFRVGNFAVLNLQRAGAAAGPDMSFVNSRGTINSPTASVNADELGVFKFRGYETNGTRFAGAVFGGYVDGTVGVNTLPTQLSFFTSTRGATNSNDPIILERMTIKASGFVGIGTKFPEAKLDIGGGSFTVRSPYGIKISTMLVVVPGAGNVGIGESTPTSRLYVMGGSITVRDGSSGIGGGISASSYTVRGTPIISSTWSVRAYEGFMMLVTSGSIAANTTITINTTDAGIGMSAFGIPICAEMEDVNTAGTSIRLKDTLSATSFQVYNSDIVNAKKFTCHIPARPN